MKNIIFILAIAMALSWASCSAGKKCRLLCLEGGGTKGAFQSGALKAFVEFLNPDDIKYDVVSGASVGSLNGILIAATEIGKEKELSQRMSNLWATIKSTDILADWSYFGLVRAFFDKTSFLDNSPLLTYIKTMMNSWGNKIHRKYTITTVNVETTETFIATEGLGAAKIPEYVVASAAVPGIFPSSIINGSMYIDGGTRDNINVKGGVERCREMVDKDEDIIIDVLMTNALKKSTVMDMSNAKTYTAYSRGNEISSEGQSYWYVHDVLDAYPNVNWRYFVVPKEALPNFPVIALSFDRETLRKSEQIGYELTKDLIQSKATFREVFERASAAIPGKIRLH